MPVWTITDLKLPIQKEISAEKAEKAFSRLGAGNYRISILKGAVRWFLRVPESKEDYKRNPSSIYTSLDKFEGKPPS